MFKFSLLTALILVSFTFGVIIDDFDDGTIGNGPGAWSGNIDDTTDGWAASEADFVGAIDGSASAAAPGQQMRLDFGGLFTKAEVEFDISQSGGAEIGYLMQMGFDTDAGVWKMESSPEVWRYNFPSGSDTSIPSYTSFEGTHLPAGLGAGTQKEQKLATSGWQHFKFVFDVNEDVFTVKVFVETVDPDNQYAAADPTFGYGELVYAAYMENHQDTPATGTTGFFWQIDAGSPDSNTWRIDNISANPIPEPLTIGLLALGAALARKKPV